MSKKFKKNVNIEEVVEMKKDQVLFLQQQCYATEKMSAICTEQQKRLDSEADGLKRRIATTEKDIEVTSKALDDDVSMMRNMSKNSEEQLKQQREKLIKTLSEAEEDVKATNTKLEETRARRQADLKKWTDEVDALKQQMDEMALVFGMRLKETLERVH